MKLKQLFTEEDAVSPVIGVILMVAITVILAAVIGTFVLGIGQNQQQTPSVTWEFDYDASAGTVDVVHDGGDSLTSDNSNEIRLTESGTSSPLASDSLGSDYEAGDTVFSGISYTSGETLRIVWEAPGGSRTATIGQSTNP